MTECHEKYCTVYYWETLDTLRSVAALKQDRAHHSRDPEALPLSFGCLRSQVTRWDCGRGRKKGSLTNYPYYVSPSKKLNKAGLPHPQMVTWPFFLSLKSDRSFRFRTKWEACLQSNWKKEQRHLGPRAGDPVPREPVSVQVQRCPGRPCPCPLLACSVGAWRSKSSLALGRRTLLLFLDYRESHLTPSALSRGQAAAVPDFF